jgi:hypothetical protein
MHHAVAVAVGDSLEELVHQVLDGVGPGVEEEEKEKSFCFVPRRQHQKSRKRSKKNGEKIYFFT